MVRAITSLMEGDQLTERFYLGPSPQEALYPPPTTQIPRVRPENKLLSDE